MEITSWAMFFEILGALMISGYTPLFIFAMVAVLFMMAIAATFMDKDNLEEVLQAACCRYLIWGLVFSAIWATVKWILN